MRELRKLYTAFGGKGLLLQWYRADVLPYALFQMFTLGFSKKKLEILRLLIRQRIYRKLKRKSEVILKKSISNDYECLEKSQSNKVWVCWFQGIENAPILVKECYKSIHKHLSNREVILLTDENIKEYVDLPKHILEKRNNGIISNTHFSDILRVEILINYGGTWIDSTVLCTGGNIPEYLFNSELFLYQILKPGRDGHTITTSSWFMSSTTNNKILLITRDLLFEYWKKNNHLIDYFLLHFFIEIVLNAYPEEREKIIKFCNSIPHILLLDLFETFDENKYAYMNQMTSFHKLNYKRPEQELSKKGTYYDVIINHSNY